MEKQIESLEDIRLLVDSFYEKVRQDEILGPVFNDQIHDWPPHLDKMYRFWQSILLNEHTYSGAPFPKHATLPIGQEHFQRWLSLFYETVDGLFSGNKAPESKNSRWRLAAFRGYADYMDTDDYKEGIQRLQQNALTKRVAYMCSEAVWWSCHRALVSDHLKALGWNVVHIMGAGKGQEHPFTSAATIVAGKLSYEA